MTTQSNALVRGRGSGAASHDGPHTDQDERGLKETYDVDKDEYECLHCHGPAHKLGLEIFEVMAGIPDKRLVTGNYGIEQFNELRRLLKCGSTRWKARWDFALRLEGKYKYGWRLCYDGWVIPNDHLIVTEKDVLDHMRGGVNHWRDRMERDIGFLDYVEDLILRDKSTPKRTMIEPHADEIAEEGRQEQREVRRRLDMDDIGDVEVHVERIACECQVCRTERRNKYSL